MTAVNEKDAIRRSMKERRRSLGEEEQRRQASCLAGHVLASPQYASARTVMLYMACGGEIRLDGVMLDVLQSGRRLCLPLCGAPGMMTARLAASPEELRPGAYGVMEPAADCPIVPPEEIDLVLVPGTAFDRRGGRLGQGGGYYDRYLAGTRAFLMGVCHSFALLEGPLPCCGHDVRMHAVATPEGILYMEEQMNHCTIHKSGGTRR